MKKIIVIVLAVFVLFTSCAFAAIRAPRTQYSLSFSGSTANFFAVITEKDKNISMTVKLFEGSALVETMSNSGKTSVSVSGSHAAQSGQTYKLVVNYSVNGGSTQTVSTTKTCP